MPYQIVVGFVVAYVGNMFVVVVNVVDIVSRPNGRGIVTRNLNTYSCMYDD